MPYTIDMLKSNWNFFTQSQAEKMKANMDWISHFVYEMPKLSDLFEVWEKKIHKSLLTTQCSDVGNLDKFYNHLEASGQISSDKSLIIKKNASKTGQNSFDIKITPKITNLYVLQEIDYVLEEDIDYPTPACDFWVQKKKSSDKDYPCEYLFALHCTAALAGNMCTNQLNYLCDRISRFIVGN